MISSYDNESYLMTGHENSILWQWVTGLGWGFGTENASCIWYTDWYCFLLVKRICERWELLCHLISFFSFFLQESHMDLLIWCMVLTNMKARQNIFLLFHSCLINWSVFLVMRLGQTKLSLLALHYFKSVEIGLALFQLVDLIFELI